MDIILKIVAFVIPKEILTGDINDPLGQAHSRQ